MLQICGSAFSPLLVSSFPVFEAISVFQFFPQDSFPVLFTFGRENSFFSKCCLLGFLIRVIIIIIIIMQIYYLPLSNFYSYLISILIIQSKVCYILSKYYYILSFKK